MAAKKQKIRNVPNLRFQGFEEGWERKKLGDFIDVITGIPLQSEDILEDKSGIPILRGINITEGFIRHSKEIDRYYPKDKTTKINKYLLEEGDLVIGMDGSKVGKNVALISKFDIGSILIQRVARVRALGNASTNYIFQKVFSKEFQNYVDVVNTSSGIPHISLQQIKDFETGFPQNLAEQKKIAAFLTLIDERITTQNKIIEDLETLIQNLREKLFMQKLTFNNDNGGGFPKWKVIKLGEIGEIITGLTYKPNEVDEKGVLVLRSSNVQRRTLTFDDNVFVSVNKYNPVLENDILICVRNGSKDLIGKNAIIKKEHEGYAFGAFMTVYRSVYNKFLFQWFDTEQYKSEVHKNLGATINSINGRDLKNFKVPFPSKIEQAKIANFLSFIDNKIEMEKRLLSQYESQKKYLLQNMFT